MRPCSREATPRREGRRPKRPRQNRRTPGRRRKKAAGEATRQRGGRRIWRAGLSPAQPTQGRGKRLHPTPRCVADSGSGRFIALLPREAGTHKAVALVDLARRDYSLDPHVTFTPDGRWLVFRSNMHGPSHVYAVEVAKSL